MSESTLSLTYDDLRDVIAYRLGYGRGYTPWAASTAYGLGQRVRPTTQNGYVYECTTSGTSHTDEPTWGTTAGATTSEGGGTVVWTNRGWVADNTVEIEDLMKTTVRTVCNPPVPIPHVWSWLKPVTSIDVWPTTTGTATTHTTTLESATAVFYPSMVGQTVVFDDSENEFTITAYASATSVTIDPTATAETDLAFTITPSGCYRLPDDFGGMIGALTYEPSAGYVNIETVGEGKIRQYRMGGSVTGYPRFAAIRSVAPTGTAGQKSGLMLWPTPDAVYTLSYKYNLLINALTSSSPYPPGGAQYAELWRAAAMACAEVHMQEVRGEKWQYFMEELSRMILLDQDQSAPDMLMPDGYVRIDRQTSVTYTQSDGTVITF